MRGATIGLVGLTWAALRERYYSAVMAATGLLYLAILTAFGTDLVARAVLRPVGAPSVAGRTPRTIPRWTSHPCSATTPTPCSPTSPRPSRRRTCTSRAPTSSTGSGRQRPPGAGAAQPAGALRPRPPRRHRLRLDPAGRPGHRALGGRVVRAEPDLLRPREHRRSWRSRAAATRSPRRSACSARWRASTRTSIPFIVKLNHNELLTYPNKFDQIMFGTVKQACDMGAAASARRSTSAPTESTRQIQEVARGVPAGARARACSPCCGATCATPRSRQDGVDYHAGRRPHRPGQPPRRDDRGRHHQAEAAREQRRLQRAQLRQDAASSSTTTLTTDHPIDLTRYQVVNCYMGRAGLINSRRRVVGRRATSRKRSRPRSSTSAPAAWA